MDGSKDSKGIPSYSNGSRGIKPEILKEFKVGLLEEKFRNDNGGL